MVAVWEEAAKCAARATRGADMRARGRVERRFQGGTEPYLTLLICNTPCRNNNRPLAPSYH